MDVEFILGRCFRVSSRFFKRIKDRGFISWNWVGISGMMVTTFSTSAFKNYGLQNGRAFFILKIDF